MHFQLTLCNLGFNPLLSHSRLRWHICICMQFLFRMTTIACFEALKKYIFGTRRHTLILQSSNSFQHACPDWFVPSTLIDMYNFSCLLCQKSGNHWQENNNLNDVHLTFGGHPEMAPVIRSHKKQSAYLKSHVRNT